MQSVRALVNSTANLFRSLFTAPIQNQDKFSSLFLLIRKNKRVAAFLAEIKGNPAHEMKVAELLSAINEGDPEASIFDDQLCYLYLLFLIKENKIAFDHGMTVYHYLMALQQFTDRQPLKPEDVAFKMKRDLRVRSLFAGSVLTEMGAEYLRNVANDLERFTSVNVYHELVAYMRELPPSEKWVMLIPCSLDTDKLQSNEYEYLADYEGFDLIVFRILRPIRGYAQVTPYFQPYFLPGQEDVNLIFPSISLIHFCLRKVSEQPLMPAFHFGCVGQETLHRMHSQHQHPALLYALDVQSSTLQAHGYRCGPMGVAFHDFVHDYWGSLLPPAFRGQISHVFIPILRKTQAEARKLSDLATVEAGEAAIEKIDDYDLLSSAGRLSKEKDHRFDYLTASLAVNGFGGGSSDPIGSRPVDAVLFILTRLRRQDNGWTDEERACMKQLSRALSKIVDTYRHGPVQAPVVSRAIRALAKSPAGPARFYPPKPKSQQPGPSSSPSLSL